MISGYMRLKEKKPFAIRYHMGFAGNEDARNVGAAFEMFPLAFALSTADMEATYFMEGKIILNQNKLSLFFIFFRKSLSFYWFPFSLFRSYYQCR